MEKKAIRKVCNITGLQALAYYALMNVSVMIVMCVDMIVYLAQHMDYLRFADMVQHLMDFAVSNGWGYLLSVVIGGVIVSAWKGFGYWKETVFAKEKKMDIASFACMFSVFVAVQALLQLFAPVLEWVLNLMGLSAMAALEAASITSDTFSMFLYLSFLGPIAEELLFRGLILRTLTPYGKRFAIVMSSVLFALLHGNIVQSPFAFLVGIVLAYVTLEYSIVWAIILHIFNNFVLSDLLTRLSVWIPGLGDVIFLGLIIAAAIVTLAILLLRRREVVAYFKADPINPTAAGAFFTAPGVLIFVVIMGLMSLLSITPL